MGNMYKKVLEIKGETFSLKTERYIQAAAYTRITRKRSTEIHEKTDNTSASEERSCLIEVKGGRDNSTVSLFISLEI